MKKKLLFLFLPIFLLLGSCNEPPVEATYVVNYEHSADYRISGLQEKYHKDDVVNFTIDVVNDLKELSEVSIDNSPISPVNDIYSFTMPNHDVDLVVTLANKKTDISYNIKYTMSGSTSYAFKENEKGKILETFDAGEEDSIIQEVSGFITIYGGGYGTGANAWTLNNVLKFGTGSASGQLTLSLSIPVNKVTITGLTSNTSVKLQVGDSNSPDWGDGVRDDKTTIVTCTNMNLANKDNANNKNFSNIDVEFSATNSIRINATKAFYIASIKFYFASVKTYKAIWKDDNGDILKTDDVLEGNIPSYTGETPSKEGHDFVGWTPTPSEIHQNTTYIATYTPKGTTYKVMWLNYNNELIKAEDVLEGTTPKYVGNIPTKPSTEEYDYIFSGWDPTPGPISSDTNYIATYIEKAKSTTKPGYDPVISSDNTYIEYGFYPQSRVSDSDVITSLETLSPSTSNGWYVYGEEFYMKAVGTTCNGDSYKFDNGDDIENDHIYWFKCEPIKWNIMSINNNQYTLISRDILDAMEYHSSYEQRVIDGDEVNPNNYRFSDIYSWLNNEFINFAFAFGSSNLVNTSFGKAYLPSVDEVNELSVKTAKTSEYSRTVGVWSNKTDNAYLYNGAYWTRTASTNYNYAVWNVNSGGVLSEYAVDGIDQSLRPCITISL